MKALKNIITLLTACYLVLGFAEFASGQQDVTLSTLIEQARQAGVNEVRLHQLADRAENHGIGDEDLLDIIAAAVALAEQRLPSEAALNKALEGISKGIDSGVIASSVREIQSSTVRASHIVDPWLNSDRMQNFVNQKSGPEAASSFRNDVIQQVGRGLRANIKEEAYLTLLSEISEGKALTDAGPVHVIAAVGMIPDLPAEAADQAKIARVLIINALTSGLTPLEMQELPIALNRAKMHGRNPVSDLLNALNGQTETGIPAGHTVQNLFEGALGASPLGSLPIGLKDTQGLNGANTIINSPL